MWLSSNRLLVNAKKTKYIVWNKHVYYQNVTLNIDGIELEHVDNFKFLGCWLDSKLSWNKHVDELCTKLRKSIFIINKLKMFVPLYCLRYLYFAHFHSHLCHANAIWGNGLNAVSSKRIFFLQKRAIRIVCGKTF